MRESTLPKSERQARVVAREVSRFADPEYRALHAAATRRGVRRYQGAVQAKRAEYWTPERRARHGELMRSRLRNRGKGLA